MFVEGVLFDLDSDILVICNYFYLFYKFPQELSSTDSITI